MDAHRAETVPDRHHPANSAVIGIGDVFLAFRGEAERMIKDRHGDCSRAIADGIKVVAARGFLREREADDLVGILELLDRQQSKELSQRVHTVYAGLIIDPDATPTALAILSGLNAITGQQTGSEPQTSARFNVTDAGHGALAGALLAMGVGSVGALLPAVVVGGLIAGLVGGKADAQNSTT